MDNEIGKLFQNRKNMMSWRMNKHQGPQKTIAEKLTYEHMSTSHTIDHVRNMEIQDLCRKHPAIIIILSDIRGNNRNELFRLLCQVANIRRKFIQAHRQQLPVELCSLFGEATRMFVFNSNFCIAVADAFRQAFNSSDGFDLGLMGSNP